MVIWFNLKKARNFLLKYTIRTKRCREGKDVLMFDGFGVKGYVFVEFVKANKKCNITQKC